jgi:hypothetical protein
VRKGDSIYFVGLDKTDIIRASCNCPDWRFHSRKKKVPCKHMWLVAEDEGLVTLPTEDQLPPEEKEEEEDEGREEEGKPVQYQEKIVRHDEDDDDEREVEEIDIPLD